VFYPHDVPPGYDRGRESFDGLLARINDGLDRAIHTVNQIESLYRKLESLSPELDKIRSWLNLTPGTQPRMSTRSTAQPGRRRQRRRRSGVRP